MVNFVFDLCACRLEAAKRLLLNGLQHRSDENAQGRRFF